MRSRCHIQISIPAAHAGCDLSNVSASLFNVAFQSPQPMRAATLTRTITCYAYQFQSPQPMRAATQHFEQQQRLLQFQSPQPMRAATICIRRVYFLCCNFNPRSPCGLRPEDVAIPITISDFNPRSPCGLRHAIF